MPVCGDDDADLDIIVYIILRPSIKYIEIWNIAISMHSYIDISVIK